jgi:Fe-S-cluster containining protein
MTKFFHHTLVEEQYLAEGFASLSDDQKRNVCSRAVQVVKVYASSPEDVRIMCPLNEGGMCVLYEHRPMICRMHGVPYEMAGEDGSVEFGSGCHRFMAEKASETTHYFMFNRTMFYREMAKLEREVRASLGFSGECRKTVADMLVDMCGR